MDMRNSKRSRSGRDKSIGHKLEFLDRWEVRVKPSVRKKMTEKGAKALRRRLQDHAGGFSLEHFRSRSNATRWLNDLPEGLRSRCEVSQVAYLVF